MVTFSFLPNETCPTWPMSGPKPGCSLVQNWLGPTGFCSIPCTLEPVVSGRILRHVDFLSFIYNMSQANVTNQDSESNMMVGTPLDHVLILFPNYPTRLRTGQSPSSCYPGVESVTRRTCASGGQVLSIQDAPKIPGTFELSTPITLN